MHKTFYFPLLLLISIIGLVAFIDNDNKKIQAGAFIVDTLATNLTVPWAFTFLDSTKFLFTERNGKVRLMHNDQLAVKPMLLLQDADTTKKMGVLGLCKHPGFATNHLIYIAYNYSRDKTAFLRIVRYTFDEDSLVNPFIIKDSIYASSNHTGCRLRFGFIKQIYITTSVV